MNAPTYAAKDSTSVREHEAKSLALDPQYRAMRIRGLAQVTLASLGAANDLPDAATILEHSVTQACAELEAVGDAIRHLDETSVLFYVVEGIRLRLELANDCGDLLAWLLAAPVQKGAAE